MAINKATLAKEIDGVIEYIYPKTSADIVVYDDTHSVAAAIHALENNKVDKEDGKGLSSNDFTDNLRSKLEGVDSGANKTIIDSALSSASNNAISNKVVKAALDEKEENHLLTPYTLRASNWSGNTYSFEGDYPGTRYTIYVNITACQPQEYDAICRAMLMGSDVSTGQNVMTALGEVPMIDLPVLLEVVKN